MEQAEPAPSRREQDGRASLERDRETAVRHRDDALEASIVDQHRQAAHQEGRVARAETRLARLEQDERERRAWQSRLDEACGRQAAAIGEQRRREAEQQRDAVRTLPDPSCEPRSIWRGGRCGNRSPRSVSGFTRGRVELRKVEKELATRSHYCEQVAQKVARDRQALESRSPLARLRRGERATLKFALPWGERRLAEEQEKVRDLQARRERLQKDAADQGAWQQRQKLARDRAEAVREELSARQRGRLAELTSAPPAQVIQALGERPEGLWERASWQQAASALHAYVERHESADAALADISHSAQTRDLRAVAEQVAAVRKRLQAEGYESAMGRKPSVGERVGRILGIEERRAEQARRAAKSAANEPVQQKPYSQDHHYGQHHHRGLSQQPSSVSMGP